MRIGCISACIFALSLKILNALTIAGPLNGWTINVGVSTSLDWLWDGLPTGNDDGAFNVLLVTDTSASSVVATLATGVPAIGLQTSITIPSTTASGQYYIQLKVTSGSEKSAVGGPYNVVGVSSSSSISTSAMSTKASSTGAPFSTNASVSMSWTSSSSNTVVVSNTPAPKDDTQADTTPSSSSNSPALPTAAIAGITVGAIVLLCAIAGSVSLWYRRMKLYGAMQARIKSELPSYESPPQMQYKSNDNHGYDPQNHLNAYSNVPYGAPTQVPFNYTTGAHFPPAQQGNLHPQYAANNSPSSSVPNQSPYEMPVPVPYNRLSKDIHYQQSALDDRAFGTAYPVPMEFSRPKFGTNYSSPNTDDSTSPLNSSHTDDSSERHIPHLEEGAGRSPPHTPDPTEPQPPHSA